MADLSPLTLEGQNVREKWQYRWFTVTSLWLANGHLATLSGGPFYSHAHFMAAFYHLFKKKFIFISVWT